MNIRNVKLPLELLIGDSGCVLVDVQPAYIWSEGKRTTERDGFYYTVIVEALRFEKLRVHVITSSSEPIVDATNIDLRNPQKVMFTNGKWIVYLDRNQQLQISATAEGIQLIKAEEKLDF